MNSIPTDAPKHLPPAAPISGDKKSGHSVPPRINSTLFPLCEPMEVSLSSRTATAVNSGSTLSSAQATTPWFDKTVDAFVGQSRRACAAVQQNIERCRRASNRSLIKQAEQSAYERIVTFRQSVSQYFAEHGSDNWQSCMDWLIRLTPKDIGSQKLLNLLPLELIKSRPDLPWQLADKAQTVEVLAAQERLCLDSITDVPSQWYRNSTVNSHNLLEIYLHSTSTLRYHFLQVALQQAPLAKVESLLRHWLYDKDCEDIAAHLSAAPLHPTMIIRKEPLLQDLLTLCATRLLQPTTRTPVRSLLPDADDRLLAKVASADNKVTFGRTIGAIGAGDDGRNLYLKCRRFNEQERDFMAEPVMLSFLHTTQLQLESATPKPHGATTFGTLESLFKEQQLNAKQKTDLVSTIAYNKKKLVTGELLYELLAKHSPESAAARHEQYMQRENRDNPYYIPRDIQTAQQIAHFLLNLPFPEKNRADFVEELLPGLDDSLRTHIVQQSSTTLNDEQIWELMQTIVPAATLQVPVTAYLFSTPPEAHYHRYVTDSDLQSEASQPLAERPQIQALSSYLRDYGRLFHQGVLGPPACNLFHETGIFAPNPYRFIYTSHRPTRPGRIEDFDGDSSNYPNIGPVPMSLRDGGDGRCITPVGWQQQTESSSKPLPQKLHLSGTVEKKEVVVESLASAWLGTVLLLGRILKAGTERHPDSWFNSRDPQKENELADLLGEMVVDLFSHSFAVNRTALHARLCEQNNDRRLIERCAREMQAWMSDAFIDHILAKEVPVWLYPDYSGQRESVLIPGDASSNIRYELEHGRPEGEKTDLGLPFASTPLQGIEILIKKALAESVLLGS